MGKSSLLNAITRQQVSIVSEVAGTTTDPVEKPMELLPLGPVLFIDTAGIDEAGGLGGLRVEKTRQVLERTEIACWWPRLASGASLRKGLLAELRRGRSRSWWYSTRRTAAPERAAGATAGEKAARW